MSSTMCREKNAVPFHWYFGPIQWIPLFSDKKRAIDRDATYTNKQKQASRQTINHYLLSKLLLNLYFKWRTFSQDGAFRTQATANEHLLNVSVCNGWKLEDLTLSVNSKSVHLLISICLMSCVSAGRINRIFHLDHTHVWACHVLLRPKLYLIVIVCLLMEIVSFSCVDNVQQLLFTSDYK